MGILDRLFTIYDQNGPVECGEAIDAIHTLTDALIKARAWVAVYETMPGHDAAARSMLRCIDTALTKAKGE